MSEFGKRRRITRELYEDMVAALKDRPALLWGFLSGMLDGRTDADPDVQGRAAQLRSLLESAGIPEGRGLTRSPHDWHPVLRMGSGQMHQPAPPTAQQHETLVAAIIQFGLFRQKRLVLTIRVLDLLAEVLPKRIADEELGDAKEYLQLRMREGRPLWQLRIAAVSRMFWACVHAIGYFRRVISGKHDKEKT